MDRLDLVPAHAGQALGLLTRRGGDALRVLRTGVEVLAVGRDASRDQLLQACGHGAKVALGLVGHPYLATEHRIDTPDDGFGFAQ